VAVSRKNALHVSKWATRLNVEAQPSTIRWSIQWYCKLQNILPICYVPSFYNELHLFTKVHKFLYWSNGLVSSLARFFPIQQIKIQQKKWPINPNMQQKICAIEIHLRWILHIHNPCLLLSLSFLATDFTSLDRPTFDSLSGTADLTVARHFSASTMDAFDFSVFLTCSNSHKWQQIC